jgi:hypothetical protein
VVQTAVLLILEPIFEADFLECSHGFRPGRGATGALQAIEVELKAGRTQVYDADLKGYFDTIPHDKLLACVKMRVVDGSILALLRAWLEAPVGGAAWSGEGLDVQTTNGGVTLMIPENYSAELELGTTNGRVNVDFPITVQGRIGRQMRTTLGEGGRPVRVVTTNGGVRVARR